MSESKPTPDKINALLVEAMTKQWSVCCTQLASTGEILFVSLFDNHSSEIAHWPGRVEDMPQEVYDAAKERLGE